MLCISKFIYSNNKLQQIVQNHERRKVNELHKIDQSSSTFGFLLINLKAKISQSKKPHKWRSNNKDVSLTRPLSAEPLRNNELWSGEPQATP